jgi:hypothetical protein
MAFFSPSIDDALERQDLDALAQAIAADPGQHSAVGAGGDTLLHYTVAFGMFDSAQRLLDAGANLNARNSAGLTPLHQAAAEGPIENVAWLLSRGADPNLLDNFGDSPLYLASLSFARTCGEGGDVIQLLRRNGAAMDLLIAIYLGDFAYVEASLQHDPTAIERLSDANRIVRTAIDFGRDRILEVLLNHWSEIRSGSTSSQLLLHASNSPGSTPDAVDALLRFGADPLTIDRVSGKTAIQTVQEQGRADLANRMRSGIH